MKPDALSNSWFLLVLVMLACFHPCHSAAATVFLGDDIPLAAGALTKPSNRIPVLFVHGHDPAPDPNNRNYKKNFHPTTGCAGRAWISGQSNSPPGR